MTAPGGSDGVAAVSAPFTPAEPELRACLDRVLSSSFFLSRRRGELLRYVVERALEGKADSIGEYGIGLDVFGKPESFDPRIESTVRAEMSRLRKGLTEYYASEGAHDPWHFEFPARGYVPIWVRAEAPPEKLPPVLSPRVTATTRSRKLWLILALACLVVIALAAALWHFRAPRVPIRSVAVLSFANLTGDAANDFLGDGISEGLTDALVRVDSLRVVARTSAFQFRGKAQDIREIGRRLNADAVVEGSIRRIADHLAVTVQVNRAADGFHILSRVFECRPSDIGRIEQELAVPVLAALLPELRSHPASQRVADSEARTLVMKARLVRGDPTIESFDRAVTMLNDAVRRDPQYAGAWVELANTYAGAAVNLNLDEVAAANMAKSAARKALELDPSAAGAWSSEGFVDAMVFLNWKQGKEELRQALRLAPQDALIHQRLSNILLLNGEFDEALNEGRISEQLDPLASNAGMSVGMTYYMRRRYDLALAQWQKVVELHPDAAILRVYTGTAFDALGNYAQALNEYGKATGVVEPRIVLVLIHQGRLDEARQRLARYADSPESDPFSLAVIYGALGEKDRAFSYLEQAWQHRNCWMLKVYPPLDPLRSDPRFQTFLKRANFLP
jgi:serine/threonine-protein kinase